MTKKRVVLAEYFTAEDRTLLFIIRNDFDEPVVKEIPISGQDIRDFVRQNFQQERGPNNTIIKRTGTKVKDLDPDIFQSFLQPLIAPLIEQSSEHGLMTAPDDIIWFVPHDFLHYLPLHAIEINGQALIERNSVCYTPSASVMKYCHAKRKKKRENILIFADSQLDRIHTQQQAKAIEVCFKESPYTTSLYLGEEVTKDVLKQKLEAECESIDILHLACHGQFDAIDALQSSIRFAKDETLTAEDIFGLKMNADLVTLSACESGINDNKPGDELIGLTRALIYAGTPSVIVSLWEVEEIATSIIMTKFYENLQMGQSKVEALRTAQLSLKAMTISDVIEYCEVAKDQSTDSKIHQLLDMDIANMQVRANDFDTAKKSYERLQKKLNPGTQQYNRVRQEMTILTQKRRVLSMQLTGAKSEKNRSIIVHYDIPVYKDLFYWSPFVLVGDWK